MKLIDLLVQELPKRGGWNENWVVVTQDADGYFCCWRYDDPKYNRFGWRHVTGKGLVEYWRADNDVVLSCDSTESMVTRSQYESALAASKNPTWNGEGVPPAGCECEYSLNGGSTWWKCKIDYIVGTQGVVMLCDTFEGVQYVHFSSYGDSLKFKPIRTEADKKRDAAAKEMARYANTDEHRKFNAGLRNCLSIYDAIAAGKIPGVKLED